MRVIDRSLSSNILRILLETIITCRLDYCNWLLAGLPACDVSRLQSIHNQVDRLYGGVSRYDSICCVTNSSGCQSSTESNSWLGCLDTRPSTVLRLPHDGIFYSCFKYLCTDSKQICGPSGLYRYIICDHYLLSTELCSG